MFGSFPDDILEEFFQDYAERIDKDKMPCNKPKAQAVGDSLTGKSHVVKACANGKEKVIRFGQRGVKGSPKKEGESVAYANVRAPFGKRLSSNQAIQFPLVELQTQCEMIRALIHKTAWQMDTIGNFAVSDKVSMCNYWANRLCCEAADRAMQVHGGLGYSRHKPFEHIYRHHRRYRITEGSEEIQIRRVAGYMFGFMGQRAPKGVQE